ncbi:MAG: pilus assembly protein TadG-related protein [Bacillota bacterium]
MFRFLKKLWRDRRGNALVIAGAALPLVIGSAGLATDTIEWAVMKRQLQRAADSGALAGVFGKLGGQTVSTGNCSASAPISRDMTVGTVSTRIGTTPTCTVQSPPTSGAWTAASAQAVKVTMSAPGRFSFASLFMSSAPTITATATAAVVQSGKYCMISMDDQADTGINFTGNPTVNLGCGMKTNAKGSAAIDCGGSSSITASPVAAVGYIPVCNNFTSSTTYQSYSPPQTDPFASVPAPSVPNGCNQDLAFPGKSTSLTVTGNQAGWASGNPTTVCYTDFTVGSGKTFTGTDLMIIINRKQLNGSGGNLTIQGNVSCTRCVFIMTSDSTGTPTPSGNVTINAGAHIDLHAPTTGTYAGIIIYQDRRSSSCGNWCNKINGDSTSTIEGSIYMPKQEVQLNGGSGMNTNCLQIVGWQLQFAGNTSVTNTCPAGSGAKSFDGQMVRLVE